MTFSFRYLPFRLPPLVRYQSAQHPSVVREIAGACPQRNDDLHRVGLLYVCRMHPELVKRDPKTRCQGCWMPHVQKVIVADGAAPAKPSNSPAGHAGCGHGS